MSILFRRAASGTEQRAAGLIDAPGWRQTVDDVSGTGLTTALRLAPVFAAVGAVTEALVTVPLHAYRDGDVGAARLPSAPEVIANPSLSVDPLTWRGQYVASMMLRGNAYGYTLVQDSIARPTKVSWLHPDRVSVKVAEGGRIEYYHDGKEIDAGRVTHIRWITMPGEVVGLNPVALFRRMLSSAHSAAASQESFYTNGGPAAHFRNTATTLTAEQAGAAKERFRAGVKSGGLLVTGSDWEYSALGVSAADAQFIDAAKLTANQIAAIYRLPADEIGGETGSSLTYSTLEMNDLKFVRRGVLPWAVRLERAITGWLAKPQYARFNLDAYVRTDLITRMNAHTLALAAGLETQDEGRALEDRPPLDADQVAFWQDNYRKTSTPAPSAPPPEEGS